MIKLDKIVHFFFFNFSSNAAIFCFSSSLAFPSLTFLFKYFKLFFMAFFFFWLQSFVFSINILQCPVIGPCGAMLEA